MFSRSLTFQSVEYRSGDTSTSLYVTTYTIMIITTTLLALRFYARTLILRRQYWDDYLLILSWVFLMGVCILMLGSKSSLKGNIPITVDINSGNTASIYRKTYACSISDKP